MLLSEDMAEDPGNPLPRIDEGPIPRARNEEGEEGEGGRGARTSIDPIPTQRWEIEDEGDDPPSNKAKSDAGASAVSGAPFGAASAALSGTSGGSAADKRLRATLEMYHSPKVVEENFTSTRG